MSRFEFKLRRIVEFAETDMAGIMHFSNYFRYMEATEHAFFRSFGSTLHVQNANGTIGWARVHAECTYAKPLRYQDVVEVHLLVREKKARSLSYAFVLRKVDARGDGEPEEVARGIMTTVCIAKAPGDEKMRAVDMPDIVDQHIDVAPPERLA